MNRRTLIFSMAAASALAFVPAVFAQKKGTDYLEIVPPQPAGTNDKVEVVEFFSYNCPHCYDFEPYLKPWIARLPKDVSFRRVPVGFGRPEWAASARLNLTLNALGLTEKLDPVVFDSIHKGRVNFNDEKQRNAWVTAQKIDLKKFNDTWNSFGVDAQFKRSEQMARDYKVMGVPSLAINGRYLVNAGEQGAGLRHADKFIAQIRGGK